MGPAISIDPMRPADWPDVRAIYLEGIATGNATFEQTAPEWEKWDTSHLPAARIVARSDAGAVLGWAALSGVSSRCVYANGTQKRGNWEVSHLRIQTKSRLPPHRASACAVSWFRDVAGIP